MCIYGSHYIGVHVATVNTDYCMLHYIITKLFDLVYYKWKVKQWTSREVNCSLFDSQLLNEPDCKINKGSHEINLVLVGSHFGSLSCQAQMSFCNKPIKLINNGKQSYPITHGLTITEYFSSRQGAKCVVQELSVNADNLVSGASFSAEFDENHLWWSCLPAVSAQRDTCLFSKVRHLKAFINTMRCLMKQRAPLLLWHRGRWEDRAQSTQTVSLSFILFDCAR